MLTEADIVAAIKKTYDLLDDNFGALYAECTTNDQKQQLKSLLACARDAFFAAAAKSLTDNNPTVETLTKQLQDTNADLAERLVDIKDIVNTLTLCTEALKLGAALATLAAGA